MDWNCSSWRVAKIHLDIRWNLIEKLAHLYDWIWFHQVFDHLHQLSFDAFLLGPSFGVLCSKAVQDGGRLRCHAAFLKSEAIRLPETNSSHLKMDGWSTSFPLDIVMACLQVRYREVSVLRSPIFHKKVYFLMMCKPGFTSLHGYTSSQYFSCFLLGCILSSSKQIWFLEFASSLY